MKRKISRLLIPEALAANINIKSTNDVKLRSLILWSLPQCKINERKLLQELC